MYCRGLETARDSWVYNSNFNNLSKNIDRTIKFFNEQLIEIKNKKSVDTDDIKKNIEYDDKKISWSRAFVNDLKKERTKNFEEERIIKSLYRPFFRQYAYFSRELNNFVSRMDSFFPTKKHTNLVICMPAPGGNKGFGALITNMVPDLHLIGDAQCFPLYYYEEANKVQGNLFDANKEDKYIRRDGISNFILERAQKAYGKRVQREDIFYYVYGFLHSPDYRIAFTNDLKKILPRIPLVDAPADFWAFSKAGRELAELHINYESVAFYSDVIITGEETNHFHVEKMRHPKKEGYVRKKKKKIDDTSVIHYNSKISISGIPEKAYQYIVNGKSAIGWIMERYQTSTDKKSGITNDPNDWSDEVDNPRYILDLLLSVINVSVQTVDIVDGLPKLEFE